MKKDFRCELDDNKMCTACGECQICDLDNTKLCNNCMQCVEGEYDYKSIEIDEIIMNEEN